MIDSEFDPSETADPRIPFISLFSINISVGGFTGFEFPQQSIPYDNGDKLPPPGRSMFEIELSRRLISEVPGLRVIPLPVKSLPIILNP